jgi:DNA-directed RNA polymerase subunit K/omega
MIKPSMKELTNDFEHSRYALVIATAKCARIVTDEYVEMRQDAERQIEAKTTDRSIAALVKKEYCDQKAVKTAVLRLYDGEYQIVEPPLDDNGQLIVTEE